MKLTFLSCLLFILIVFSVGTSSGQCVRAGNLKANAFRGQVFAVTRDGKSTEIFPDATIRLLKENGDVTNVMVKVVTDSEGQFAFTKVLPGKYIFEASARYFDTVTMRLKITRKARGAKDSFLVIHLGITDYSSTDSCEGSVELKKPQ